MLTAKEVSALLAQCAEDVAKYLLPNGKREGDEFRAGNVYWVMLANHSACVSGAIKWGFFVTLLQGNPATC